MHRNAAPAVLLILAAVSALVASALPKFTLDEIRPDGADLSALFPAGSGGGDGRYLFAFSTLPGQSYTASATLADGSIADCQPLQAGWAGTDFLQWCALPSGRVQRQDTLQTATVKIRFSQTLYAAADLRRVSLVQGILRVPLPRTLAKSAAAMLPDVPYSTGVRMETDADGIYELSGRTLRDLGVPIERIPSRTYRLFEQGREIPLLLPDAHHLTLANDDVLLFYGKKLRSTAGGYEDFSETGCYWLTWGGATGARVAVVSGARRTDPTVYTVNKSTYARDYIDTLRIEQDNTILWLGNIDGQPAEELNEIPGSENMTVDNWYWGLVGLTELTNFTFTIPAPSERGYARLRCGLMGLSSIDSIGPDHNLEVFINGEPVGEFNTVQWDGQRFQRFESDTFSNDILLAGENTLTVHTLSDFTDRTALNWVEVEYLRGYGALDDRLKFKNDVRTTGTTIEYTLSGFSGNRIEVWDIGRYRTFTGCITERGTGIHHDEYSLIFQDSVNSVTTYMAQTIAGRLKPRIMQLDTVGTTWEIPQEVDYVVVSADSFATELEPLLALHRKQGLKTAFVALGDLYNRFCFGIRNPEAIRRFLQYLLARNGSLPRFLLLGGDTTHDLDKNNNGRNIVPTHLSRIPGWGPGADDGYFATVAGDDQFPDIIVGRFPAQNRGEMRTMVDKTVRYIEEPDWSYWRDQLLLLGGGEPVFSQFNDEAEQEVIGSRMRVLRMDADPLSSYYKDEFVAPQMIADYLNTGALLLNFSGHGGGNIWSDNNFFGYNDLSRLHNGEWKGGGRLPVVFSFTCLTGFFESAEYRSLGEEFLRNGRDGAIAFYGASAYTSRNGNLIMNKLLLDIALDGEWNTVGEMICCCEMNMLVRYGLEYIHLVRQYNLLGDPALPWRYIPDTLTFSQTTADSGARLDISGNAAPVRDGEVKVALAAGGQTWSQTIAPVEKGSFSCTLPLKEQVRTSQATVRVYAWNDSTAVRGWSQFVKGSVTVDDVRTEPVRPQFDDSITVFCKLPHQGDYAVEQVYCLYAVAGRNDPQLAYRGIAMQPDSGGQWTTDGRIVLPFSGSVNDRLFISFRVTGAAGNLQSRLFTFDIDGRPDLVLSTGGNRLVWRDDSLRIPFEALNAGNAAAPAFSIALLWNRTDAGPDTFAIIKSGDGLDPGKSRSFSPAIADTQGVLDFSLLVNPRREFSEILYDNNAARGISRIRFADLEKPGDTLVADSGRLRISPVQAFDGSRRLFLFDDTVEAAQPLATPSQWVVRRNTAAVQWSVATRPAMQAGDSLLWLWNRSGETGLIPPDTVFKKACFVLFDTVISRWRYYNGIRFSPSSRAVSVDMKAVCGPVFAVAVLGDDRAPDLMASVYGKVLSRPDYTAKDHPFTLLLADQSGILPQSVGLFLNSKRIDAASYSEVPVSGDLRTVSLSAYPEVEHRVDSLRIECTDLAGNLAKRTFAYLPGQDLSIKSFSCHPNPFTGRRRPDGTIQKIRFAFLLTDLAAKITLNIYTASGKKIMSFSRSNLIGYQQIEWNGRDRDGYRLANGTYYAKLVVSNDRKRDKDIIRIAKLEGF